LLVIKIILAIIFFVLGAGLLFLGGLAVWVKNIKRGLVLILLGILSLAESYETITYSSPLLFWLLLIFFTLLGLRLYLYIEEPDLSITDWLKSPERLLKEGRKEQAAIKLRRGKKWEEAGKIYEELSLLSSAIVCYEEAGKWEDLARIYERLAEEGEHKDYYLRKAREIYEEKLKNPHKAAEVLEKLAEIEEWFWDDVAKMWEKCKNFDKAKEAWERALNVAKRRAIEEDGVFWSDVAEISERLGKPEEAIEGYKKFVEFCLKMEEKEGKGWIRHVAEGYFALYRLTGDESYKTQAEDALNKFKQFLDEFVLDENLKYEIIEEVKKWERGIVESKI
jgi:tetratricopeptide (TPR) repeat protein